VGAIPRALVWKSDKAALAWFYDNNIAEKHPDLRAALEELQARAPAAAGKRRRGEGSVSGGPGGALAPTTAPQEGERRRRSSWAK
jgi:hypothetical protein